MINFPLTYDFQQYDLFSLHWLILLLLWILISDELYHKENFSAQWRIFIKKINYLLKKLMNFIVGSNFDAIIDVHHNDELVPNARFSAHLWMFITMKNFHRNDDLVQLQWWILSQSLMFTTMMNFQCNDEFSYKCSILIKMITFC